MAINEEPSSGRFGIAPVYTVSGFQVCLPGLEQILQAECPAREMETRLMASLQQPIRLLRWALVQTEQRDGQFYFRCEGAYLKVVSPS